VNILAPIEPGDQLGAVKVTLRDKEVSSRPLVALNGVEKGSFLQRAYDSALMQLQ